MPLDGIRVRYSGSLLFPLTLSPTLRLTLTLTLTQTLAQWRVSAQWIFGIADLRNSGPVPLVGAYCDALLFARWSVRQNLNRVSLV